MAQLTVNGKTESFEDDKRLVIAIEEMGVNIGHRCGGKARCTTCRVEFVSGEPAEMTRAEYDKLKEKDMLGTFRLSCQLTCSQNMEVKPEMTLESVEGWTDTGPELDPEVKPAAEWFPKAELESA